jgi:hemoglobin
MLGSMARLVTAVPLAALLGGCGLFGSPKPLWERLGGEDAVRAVVSDFVDRSAKDPRVGFDRGGKYKFTAAAVSKLKDTLVKQISSVTGGPLAYDGKDMKTVHTGMRITEAEFNALADNLIWVLNKYKVPQAEQDELIGIIASTKGDIVEVSGKPGG